MTLEEYKAQTKQIQEEINKFQGNEEELTKLLEDLANKYPELNEFNEKAIKCEDLESFVKLAKSYGIEFSSEESSKILFDSLKKSSKTLKNLTTGELDEEALDMINGGTSAKTVFKKIGLGTAGVLVCAAGGLGVIGSVFALGEGMEDSLAVIEKGGDLIADAHYLGKD